MSYCKEMKAGEILNAHKIDAPLVHALLYGDKITTTKLSRRLSCAIKHLPLRVQFEYQYDALKAIDAGVTKNPTLVLDGEILLEGLTQTESIAKAFELRSLVVKSF